MKVYSILTALALSLSAYMPSANAEEVDYHAKAQACYDAASKRLEAEAETTADFIRILNICHADVDELLNKAYKETLAKLKEKAPDLVKKFQTDQRAWIDFVESFQMEASTNFGGGGTMYKHISIDGKIILLIQRIAYFKQLSAQMSDEE